MSPQYKDNLDNQREILDRLTTIEVSFKANAVRIEEKLADITTNIKDIMANMSDITNNYATKKELESLSKRQVSRTEFNIVRGAVFGFMTLALVAMAREIIESVIK